MSNKAPEMWASSLRRCIRSHPHRHLSRRERQIHTDTTLLRASMTTNPECSRLVHVRVNLQRFWPHSFFDTSATNCQSISSLLSPPETRTGRPLYLLLLLSLTFLSSLTFRYSSNESDILADHSQPRPTSAPWAAAAIEDSTGGGSVWFTIY